VQLLAPSEKQLEIMHDFYSQALEPISFTKKQRKSIEQSFKKSRTIDKVLQLETRCPAFYAELKKALDSGKNIQGAVFSECVYVQLLAKKFNLTTFINPLNSGILSDILISNPGAALGPR